MAQSPAFNEVRELMSCYLDEFVSRVATMLQRGAPPEQIGRLLETLRLEYRAEVLTAARHLVQEREAATRD